MQASLNIFLLPTAGELLPVILSVYGAGNNDGALCELSNYAHETEDAWALLPDDAWAIWSYADGTLSLEVWSAHSREAVLTRRLPLSPEQFTNLAAGILVFTAPAETTFEEFREQLERGEWDDLPLSIHVKGQEQ